MVGIFCIIEMKRNHNEISCALMLVRVEALVSIEKTKAALLANRELRLAG